MIAKNQNLKFNNFYLFILFYISLVVGFYLGEDLNFGATEDWLRTDFPVIKDLSIDLKNKADGAYLYKLNAIMNSGQIVEGDTLLLDIFFILEPPEISASDEIIIQNQIVNFTWNTVENIAWYSIIVENSEGVVKEIYNGTQNFTEVDFLEIGQNRIRLQAALKNGKISDLSPSIFVTVEDILVVEEESRGVLAIGIPSTVLAISLAVVFKRRWNINE